MSKLAGVGAKPRLTEIKRGCHARQHAGPREGQLLSQGPVPSWGTCYQSAQGLKSAQRDLASHPKRLDGSIHYAVNLNLNLLTIN
ncbi:hypothetical protein PGTUg99_017575 [Puccinia graminis f. sp. tritici]|uniref:Uncharacterized protein n=1 Tax=Puccinia graminis f. sp. tritici TaxID=56615 RepID=A0A5B0RI86_PUCGR|nr:hypothetical protein PGTUg99_017575 [Puccinia graminis f. sp. tritici]